jgi:hypothetical protein
MHICRQICQPSEVFSATGLVILVPSKLYFIARESFYPNKTLLELCYMKWKSSDALVKDGEVS